MWTFVQRIQRKLEPGRDYRTVPPDQTTSRPLHAGSRRPGCAQRPNVTHHSFRDRRPLPPVVHRAACGQRRTDHSRPDIGSSLAKEC